MGCRFWGARGSLWGSLANLGSAAVTASAWRRAVSTSRSGGASQSDDAGPRVTDAVRQPQVPRPPTEAAADVEQRRALAGPQLGDGLLVARAEVADVVGLHVADDARHVAAITQRAVDHDEAGVGARSGGDGGLGFEVGHAVLHREPQLLGRLAAGRERKPRGVAGGDRLDAFAGAEHAALDTGVDDLGPAVAADGPGGVAGGDTLAEAVVGRLDPEASVDPADAVDEHDARWRRARRVGRDRRPLVERRPPYRRRPRPCCRRGRSRRACRTRAPTTPRRTSCPSPTCRAVTARRSGPRGRSTTGSTRSSRCRPRQPLSDGIDRAEVVAQQPVAPDRRRQRAPRRSRVDPGDVVAPRPVAPDRRRGSRPTASRVDPFDGGGAADLADLEADGQALGQLA